MVTGEYGVVRRGYAAAPMPAATFSHTVVAVRTPDEVWLALQDPTTWEGIGPIDAVWDAQHSDDGTLSSYRWSATAAGKRWEGSATTTEAAAPSLLRLTLKSSEVKGYIETAVSPNGSGTEVTVTLRAEAVGMLSTMFWGVVRGALERGLPDQVESFGRRLDA